MYLSANTVCVIYHVRFGITLFIYFMLGCVYQQAVIVQCMEFDQLGPTRVTVAQTPNTFLFHNLATLSESL